MSSHADRILAALNRGQRDSQLLDGRGYDRAYWSSAKAAVSKLERELTQVTGERDALRAVVDGAAVGEE